MMRKTIIVLATSLGMGMTQMSTDVLAVPRGAGSVGAMHGISAPGPSMRGGVVHGPAMAGPMNSPRFTGPTKFGSNHWSGDWGHRHHRFHRNFAFAAVPFAVGAYAAYDSCYTWRRVWTPWGWSWSRVYACDYPYYYDY
jgi:hypothetical protein